MGFGGSADDKDALLKADGFDGLGSRQKLDALMDSTQRAEKLRRQRQRLRVLGVVTLVLALGTLAFTIYFLASKPGGAATGKPTPAPQPTPPAHVHGQYRTSVECFAYTCLVDMTHDADAQRYLRSDWGVTYIFTIPRGLHDALVKEGKLEETKKTWMTHVIDLVGREPKNLGDAFSPTSPRFRGELMLSA